MAKLIVQRRYKYTPVTTASRFVMYDDGDIKLSGYILEDTVRPYGVKVKKHTAIPPNPSGYRVSKIFSSSRKRDMVCLHTEDDGVTIKHGGVVFTYCYAHGGNHEGHTEGCPLVNRNMSNDGTTAQGSMEKEVADIIFKWLDEGHEVKWIIINEYQEK